MPKYSRSNHAGRNGDAFAAWERETGRGWSVFEYETEIEPPFSRFAFNRTTPPLIDDARVQNRIGRFFSHQNAVPQRSDLPVKKLVPADSASGPTVIGKILSIRAHLPNDAKALNIATEQLLLSLARSASVVSFEIIGTAAEVALQISCPATESSAVISHLRSHVPQIDFRVAADEVVNNFGSSDAQKMIAVDFGLGREWFTPLPFGGDFGIDPMTPLFSVLDTLRNKEAVCLQVLFGRTRREWQQSVQEVIFDRAGKLVFANLQNRLPVIKEKLASPLLAVCLRLLVRTESRERSVRLARQTGVYLKQFSAGDRNDLFPLASDRPDIERHIASILRRTTYRNGMLLTPHELSGIVRFPSDAILSEKLKRDQNRTKAAPANSSGSTLILGVNRHNGETRNVTLSTEQRLKHAHVIGSTGSGKSTMLIRMMIQDAEQGRGFGAVDPHGDLIDSVLDRIPADRVNDVIVFDPSDKEFPVGLNVLAAHSDLEKTLLASDLVSIFKKFSSSWGDVMHSVMSNSVVAFLESDRGGSLIDLKRFLVEKSFREEFLTTVRDEEIRYYWQYEFPQIRGKPYAPLLTRLDTFLRSKLIRHIVAQKENKLDFRRIMDERKILLARLSHGAVGVENSYLLGSLLVAKFYQAALSRQDIEEENRRSFFLYLDEAHHLITESLSQIMSGGRKFGLGVVVSHQQLRQFQSEDADVLASVLSNTFARVCFRLDEDAEKLAKGFSFFTAEHLRNLSVGQAICRFEQSRYDFNLETTPLESVPGDIGKKRRAEIVENSRRTYAKPRAAVEAEHRVGRPQPIIRPENVALGPRPLAAATTGASTEHGCDPAEAPDAAEPATGKKTGRGGPHHRDLQQVIARMGENYGFIADVEKDLPEGGRVDVSLANDEFKIACEVSVTTIDYETTNVIKCLDANYDYVIVVASNRKKMPLISSKLSATVQLEHQDRIRVFDLPGLLAFLRELSPAKEVVGGRPKKTGQRLSFTKACDLLGKSASTLYRWVREGRIPFYRVGREYEFDRDELLLIGRQDLSGKRKATVKLSPLTIERNAPKTKKEQDARYRKLLKLDKIDEPLHTRREKEANDS